MITKETIGGMIFVNDSNFKNVYSESMYNAIQMYEEDVKHLIDEACTESNSLAEEVRSFYKLAIKNFKEDNKKELAEQIAKHVWGLDECSFMDCFD